jgi:hypothetical protein
MGLFDKLKAKIAVSKDDWDEHLTKAQHDSMTNAVKAAMEHCKTETDKLEKDVKFKDKPKDLEKAADKLGEEFNKKLKELKAGYKKLAEQNILVAQKEKRGDVQAAKAGLEAAAAHCNAAFQKSALGLQGLKFTDFDAFPEPAASQFRKALSDLHDFAMESSKEVMTALQKIKAAETATTK